MTRQNVYKNIQLSSLKAYITVQPDWYDIVRELHNGKTNHASFWVAVTTSKDDEYIDTQVHIKRADTSSQYNIHVGNPDFDVHLKSTSLYQLHVTYTPTQTSTLL